MSPREHGGMAFRLLHPVMRPQAGIHVSQERLIDDDDSIS